MSTRGVQRATLATLDEAGRLLGVGYRFWRCTFGQRERLLLCARLGTPSRVGQASCAATLFAAPHCRAAPWAAFVFLLAVVVKSGSAAGEAWLASVARGKALRFCWPALSFLCKHCSCVSYGVQCTGQERGRLWCAGCLAGTKHVPASALAAGGELAPTSSNPSFPRAGRPCIILLFCLPCLHTKLVSHL